MRRLRRYMARGLAALAIVLSGPALAIAWLALKVDGAPARPRFLEGQRPAPRTARGTLPPAPSAWRPSDGGA